MKSRPCSPVRKITSLAIASLMGLAASTLAGEPVLSSEKAATTPVQAPGSDKFINFSSTSLWYLYGFNWDQPSHPVMNGT
ncbi:hypothetical protein [Verrucomicrobium spinosum]|uniref:hypothetical protein n=1 Tax=Verrucomicrobium spinosum TaxID=2736 RepID=UPI0012E1EA68|nr:hypothetical protein [Verrucomicrobium spinosum]